MSKDTISIKINNKIYNTSRGKSLIQVADEHDIHIPRFCYHKKLSVVASCRMCLVEIKGFNKCLPACSTAVQDGMEAYTQSTKTYDSQKRIMEFLLINHPLDCPICDQGGECELQDISMGFGKDHSEYNESKRTFENPDLGPLVDTNMNRCIQCTRCVRFGEEIAGDKELGVINRGEMTIVGTYDGRSMNSELSGNVIDLCPVGALNSKPFKFKARPWELKQLPTISSADGVCSNINVNVLYNGQKLMRITPRYNKNINGEWISDKDRYSYIGVHSEDRLDSPMIKNNLGWSKVSWEKGLSTVSSLIKKNIKSYGPSSLATIASDSETNESFFLLQKIFRSLGSDNIDTRLQQRDLSNQVHSGVGLDCEIPDIESSDCILIIGSNVRKEMPLINHRIFSASKKNAKIYAINSSEYDFNYPVHTMLEKTRNFIQVLLSFLRMIVLSGKTSGDCHLDEKILHVTKEINIKAEYCSVVEILCKSRKPLIIMGNEVTLHENFSIIYSIFLSLKRVLGADGGILTLGNNSKGAFLNGLYPLTSSGCNASEILNEGSNIKFLLLSGLEPEFDSILGPIYINRVKSIQDVVVISPFVTDTILSYADVVLPSTTHFETEGSFTNITGTIQTFKPTINPYKESKPLWKILRFLGSNFLKLNGFQFNSIKDIPKKIEQIDNSKINFNISNDHFKISERSLDINPSISMYRTDSLIRRSYPLQLTEDAKQSDLVRISRDVLNLYNLRDANRIQCRIGNKKYTLPFVYDPKLSQGSIFIPFGIFNDQIEILKTKKI